jgi:hypothetical protein
LIGARLFDSPRTGPMHDEVERHSAAVVNGSITRMRRLTAWIPRLLVPTFTLFFLAFAMLYATSAVAELARAAWSGGDLADGLLQGLHMGVVALAVYELPQVLQEEYDPDGEPVDAIRCIRRSVTRFASVVFVALVLESLIMVIQYSQQDLAGFLYYPVAVIGSAAVLLAALGIFIKLGIPAQMEHHREGDRRAIRVGMQVSAVARKGGWSRSVTESRRSRWACPAACGSAVCRNVGPLTGSRRSTAVGR